MATTMSRLGFVDAMKMLGIGLIVYGHIANFTIMHLVAPVRPKQLGVAFFVLTLGYCLAKDGRRPHRVLFNRLFEIYLIGIAFALLISAIMFSAAGTLQLSNYLPFVLGVNVIFDNFPANPTTWYIGTYLHLLILWALLLRHITIRVWMLPLCLLLEILLRAWLMQSAGLFIAYMFLGNWMTVLMLGMYLGQRSSNTGSFTSTSADSREDTARQRAWLGPRGAAFAAIAVMGIWLVCWPMLTSGIDRSRGFPFMIVPIEAPALAALTISAAVSGIYLTWAWLVYVATRHVPSLGMTRFFARHTLFIFIAHMPVLYLLTPLAEAHVASQPVRIMVLFIICMPGLALVSEILTRAINIKHLRDRTWTVLSRGTSPVQEIPDPAVSPAGPATPGSLATLPTEGAGQEE